MNTSTHLSTGVALADAPPRKKPFRFKLGVGLLILYPLLYILAAVVPFLSLAVATKAAVAVGIMGAAEVILLLGIACVGKEAYHALKERVLKKRKNSSQAAQI